LTRRIVLRKLSTVARNKYLYLAVAWAIVGAAVLALDYGLKLEWFAIRVRGIVLSFGWLIWVMAGLNYQVHRMVQRQLRLTDEEIREYAGRLEDATPDILALVGRGVPAAQVADRILADRGIPRLVTLKYLIALGDARKRTRNDRNESSESRS